MTNKFSTNSMWRKIIFTIIKTTENIEYKLHKKQLENKYFNVFENYNLENGK